MALDTLIETLEANGRRRAADILREARAEVRMIRRRAEREEARRREEILAARARTLRAELSGEVARVRTEGRRAALEARRELLDRVFDRASERLAQALDSAAFLEALPDRISAATRYVTGDAASIGCPPGIVGAVRTAVEACGAGSGPGDRAVALVVEPDPGVGAGFRIRADGGRVTVDDTLESRLSHQRPDLEIAILQRLGRRSEGGDAGEGGRS